MSRIHIFWVWAECSVMDIVMMRHRLAFVKGWLVSRERKGGPETHIPDHPILHSAKNNYVFHHNWPEIPGQNFGLKFQARILSWQFCPMKHYFGSQMNQPPDILKLLGLFQRGNKFSWLLKLGMTRGKFWTDLLIFGIDFQSTKYNFSL